MASIKVAEAEGILKETETRRKQEEERLEEVKTSRKQEEERVEEVETLRQQEEQKLEEVRIACVINNLLFKISIFFYGL